MAFELHRNPRMRAAILLAGLLVGCYDVDPKSCAVSCTSRADCAPEHVCTDEGWCASPDLTTTCVVGPDELGPSDAPPPDAPDASVAGTYTIALTNRENGCRLPDWQVGATTPNVGLVIAQAPDEVTAEPQGLVATIFDVWLGTHQFIGTVDGSELSLVLTGTTVHRKGTCRYTVDAELQAEVRGDVLEGNLEYRARTNRVPSCGVLTDCASRQQFNGIRPPS